MDSISDPTDCPNNNFASFPDFPMPSTEDCADDVADWEFYKTYP